MGELHAVFKIPEWIIKNITSEHLDQEGMTTRSWRKVRKPKSELTEQTHFLDGVTKGIGKEHFFDAYFIGSIYKIQK